MTTTQMTDLTTFTVRTPEDMLALAPIMLGFEPEDSVVIESFGGLRPFQARSDLPARQELDAETAEILADQLVGPAQAQRADRAALLFYSSDAGATECAWRALRRRMGRAGLGIVAALRVHDGRYHPLRGDRRLREIGVPFDVSNHPFRVLAVERGLVTHDSRDGLVATTAPDPDAVAETAGVLAREGHYDAGVPASRAAQRDAAEWVRALVSDHVADGTTACTDDLARLVWLLQVRTVAHAAWSVIERRDAAGHAEFWSDALRRTPAELVPGPAALLAWSAWQAGNGALAWVGVDRCREVDDAHPLAELVAVALARAVPPDAVEQGALDWGASV